MQKRRIHVNTQHSDSLNQAFRTCMCVLASTPRVTNFRPQTCCKFGEKTNRLSVIKLQQMKARAILTQVFFCHDAFLKIPQIMISLSRDDGSLSHDNDKLMLHHNITRPVLCLWPGFKGPMRCKIHFNSVF